MNPSEASFIRSGAVLSLHLVIHHLIDGPLPAAAVVGLVNDSGLFGGGPPVDDAIRIGKYFDLLTIEDGKIRLSPSCIAEVAPHCSLPEPQVHSARAILFIVLTRRLPAWIAFFPNGPDILQQVMPDRWVELLYEAELLNFDEEEVREWWRELFNRFHEFEEAKAKAIGDIGEHLTVTYEKQRIRADGLALDPDLTVIWVARLPGDHGYDVRSVRGIRFLDARSQLDEILIEAKSSTSLSESSFRFYLTRNEWNTAAKELSKYFIYCWVGVDLASKSAVAGPFVIPAARLQMLIPTNPTEVAEWTECRFVVDLATYAISA